jgi:TolB-like protein
VHRQRNSLARPVHAYSAVPSGFNEGTRTGGATPSPHSERRLSIVVLPFANLGGDPEQDYFVDGITESLTTDLSRIAGSFVIARNTAFTFKGKAIDVQKLGRELNVRYVLEGSVQRGGNRLRVNVQLIDVETGNQFWAERFEKPSPIYSICRTKSCRGLRTHWMPSLLRLRRGAPNARCVQMRRT